MFNNHDDPASPPLRRRNMAVRLGAAAATITVVAVASSSTVAARHIDGPVRDAVVVSDRLIPMELECSGNDDGVASIGCRWTVVEQAVGVKLVRVALGSDSGRVTVARFDDPSINRFVDTPVRRGVRYAYVVRAYSAAGELVGTSRPAVAGVPAPADIEALRLDCSATSPTTVRCISTTPTAPARIVTLWRSVDGGVRERVTSSGHPFAESYGDVVPAGTSRVAYAVIATDGAGVIVARSRAEYVQMPRPPVDSNRDVDAVLADAQPTDVTPAPAEPAGTIDEVPVDEEPVGERSSSAPAEPRGSVPPTDPASERRTSNEEPSDGRDGTDGDSMRPDPPAGADNDTPVRQSVDRAADGERVEERTR